MESVGIHGGLGWTLGDDGGGGGEWVLGAVHKDGCAVQHSNSSLKLRNVILKRVKYGL